MFGTKKDNPVEASTKTGWFALKTMADIFDVTEQGFAKTVRPLIDPKDIKNAGERGKMMVRARGAINAWTEHKSNRVAGGDPLLVAGGPSPALERYRLAKAVLEEMNVEIRKGTHVPKAELSHHLMKLCGVLRSATEQVQRQFGNPPADIWNEALLEFEQGYLEVLKTPTTETHDSDTAPKPDHSIDADRVLPATAARPSSRRRKVQHRTTAGESREREAGPTPKGGPRG